MREHSMAAEDCVLRGAQWLDETTPNWWDRIELITFDITNTCKCVCGQVFKNKTDNPRDDGFTWANYHYGSDDFAHDHHDEDGIPRNWAEWNGFDAPYDHDFSGNSWSALQDYWEEQIKIRKGINE